MPYYCLSWGLYTMLYNFENTAITNTQGAVQLKLHLNSEVYKKGTFNDFLEEGEIFSSFTYK